MARRFLIAAALCLAGCTGGAPEPVRSSGADPSPSLLRAPALDVARLARTDDCASCHADVASHWMHSAHAYASFDNPWYRASVDAFREERGREESRFCAGCHDPLLLLSGDIDREVTADDELAYAGITCLVCHSVESTRTDGNASMNLTNARVLIPDPADAAEIEAHRSRLTLDPLRSAELCGSCHRSFSGPAIGNRHHIPGIDDLGDWASSAYAGAAPNRIVSVAARDCQGCHMRVESASDAEVAGAHDGVIRSHRWAASHTALASQLPDHSQMKQAVDELSGALTVDVGPVRTRAGRALFPDEARIRGGEHLVFDVLLENARVGHRFPGGVRDLHDSWVEVELWDAEGNLIGSSRPNAGSRDGVFLLRATMLDANGAPEVLHQVDRFSAPAFDRTIAPHDARAVRYSMVLPPRIAQPLRVEARVMHRKHSPQFQAFACRASRTERGLAFAAGAGQMGKVALDPCAEQPVTTVASATAWMGAGAATRTSAGGATRPEVERLLTQAVALLHSKQEHVHVARPSLDRALRVARTLESKELVARVWSLRARLAALQGRPERAVALVGRAEDLLGASPVLDRIRGDAYARVWRWKAAAAAYERVVASTPGDFRAWRNLARSHGSAGNDRAALTAAEAGLHLAPTDEDLLRSRALALQALGDPRAPAAQDRWLSHRKPDAGSALLSRCEKAHDRCRSDRQPIPHYTLLPARKIVHASIDPG